MVPPLDSIRATAKRPQPITPHDRRRCPQEDALTMAQIGPASRWLQTERVAGQSRAVRRQRPLKPQKLCHGGGAWLVKGPRGWLSFQE